MANSNRYVMRFLGLALEDDVPDHSVLSRFRTRLTKAQAWEALLETINQQIQAYNVTLTKGYPVDASITLSPCKPRTKPTYQVVNDREERDDENEAQAEMRVIEVVQPGVDSEARWTKKAGKSLFGYKQHALVDDHGLVKVVETTPANRHDSQPFIDLVDKAQLPAGARVHTDKAYASRSHHDALTERRLKNGIQDKAVDSAAIFAKACFGHPSPIKRQKLRGNHGLRRPRFALRPCHYATSS